jgi:uncharacterized RDD family membrane protein YckC
MSGTSGGPGWWIASDGKWYPPERHPDYRPQPPPPPPPPAAPIQTVPPGQPSAPSQTAAPQQPVMVATPQASPPNGLVLAPMTMAPPAAVARRCPMCGRDWGAGIACQFCNQVEGLPSGIQLSSPGHRFGGYILDWVLIFATLIIGWLIWSLIVYKNGQTPGKQLLKMRVVSLRTASKATWGTMFLREFIAKPVIGVLSYITLGIPYFWLIWDSRNQELWDKIVSTIVVDDKHDQLLPQRA